MYYVIAYSVRYRNIRTCNVIVTIVQKPGTNQTGTEVDDESGARNDNILYGARENHARFTIILPILYIMIRVMLCRYTLHYLHVKIIRRNAVCSRVRTRCKRSQLNHYPRRGACNYIFVCIVYAYTLYL